MRTCSAVGCYPAGDLPPVVCPVRLPPGAPWPAQAPTVLPTTQAPRAPHLALLAAGVELPPAVLGRRGSLERRRQAAGAQHWRRAVRVASRPVAPHGSPRGSPGARGRVRRIRRSAASVGAGGGRWGGSSVAVGTVVVGAGSGVGLAVAPRHGLRAAAAGAIQLVGPPAAAWQRRGKGVCTVFVAGAACSWALTLLPAPLGRQRCTPGQVRPWLETQSVGHG